MPAPTLKEERAALEGDAEFSLPDGEVISGGEYHERTGNRIF
jgi:hypothetical protein